MNNFSSKTTRPRDMLFFLKIPHLSRMKNVQGMQICLFARDIIREVSPPKV